MASKSESPSPKTPSSDYMASQNYWAMVGSIIEGVDALRATGSSYASAIAGPQMPVASLAQLSNPRRGRQAAESPYLPKFPNEENDDYDFRRRHAPLTNVYSDISKNLSSKPFSKELVLDEQTSQDLKDLANDIDGQGNNLHVFAGVLFKAGIDYAIDWIWIDYTQLLSAMTLADERSVGARPYWVRIPAINMLAVYSDFINGQEIITHARIYEPITRRVDYQEINIERVRVLNRQPIYNAILPTKIDGYGPPTWELFELQDQTAAGSTKPKQEWISIDSGTISIGIIPLVPFKTGERKGCSWYVKPPLKDIAFMQIEEFQQESNLKNTKDLTAFPMLAGNGVSGVDGDNQPVTITVGPHAVLFAPPSMEGRANGSWTFIEPSATSLTFLKTDLDGLRTEMRDLGMQPLATANLTVVTTANVSMKAHNQVQAWALQLKDALEQAMKITAMWLGRKNEPVVVKVHTDFGVDFEAGSELTALQSMRSAKDLSRRTLWDEFKRRGTLSDDFDPDEEDLRLADESEALNAEAEIDPVTGHPIPPLGPTPSKPPGSKPRLVAGGE